MQYLYTTFDPVTRAPSAHFLHATPNSISTYWVYIDGIRVVGKTAPSYSVTD